MRPPLVARRPLPGRAARHQARVTSAAVTDAATNGYASTYVTVHTPPSSGPYADNACAVYVQITQGQRTFLSRLFHPGRMTESTEAVGAAVTTGPGCIYLLSMTQPSNMNGTSISSPKCGIYINDTSNFNGSTVNTSSIGYAGAAPNENGSTFSQATPAPMLPVQDPCPEIPGCNYWAHNTPAATGCPTLSKNGYTGAIASGCYSGLNLNGCNVTLVRNIHLQRIVELQRLAYKRHRRDDHRYVHRRRPQLQRCKPLAHAALDR